MPPLAGTTEADRQRWFGASEARMLAHIEWRWLERMRATTLYRYRLDAAPFRECKVVEKDEMSL